MRSSLQQFTLSLCFLWLRCIFALQKQPLNILHIIIDDLRPEIGLYRFTDNALNPNIQTPNLDAFGRTATVFTNAHTQFALCCPSRTSMMTSRRPDTTGVNNNAIYWRFRGGNFTTLPQFLKEHGYYTASVGKVFHGSPISGGDDQPYSWSTRPWHSPDEERWNDDKQSWYIVEDPPTSEDHTAAKAMHKLRTLAHGTQRRKATGMPAKPWYLAVGFFKPHLPFFAPQHYFDMYSHANMALAPNRYVPNKFPLVAWSNYYELRMYQDITTLPAAPDGPRGFFNISLPDHTAFELRRAYYASVSYVDSLVGQVLNTLQHYNLHEDTVVVIHSDHGWHLGEHNEWSKMTNFDLATRVPLMIRVPGIQQPPYIQRIVELVDLFPTLVDIVGLPSLPPCKLRDTRITALCTEGMSMLSLLYTGPNRKNIRWFKPAFSQSFRPEGPYMGYSIRTKDYRYTKWVYYDLLTSRPYWEKVVGDELYVHVENDDENINYSLEPRYQPIKEKMEKLLIRGWQEYIS